MQSSTSQNILYIVELYSRVKFVTLKVISLFNKKKENRSGKYSVPEAQRKTNEISIKQIKENDENLNINDALEKQKNQKVDKSKGKFFTGKSKKIEELEGKELCGPYVKKTRVILKEIKCFL